MLKGLLPSAKHAFEKKINSLETPIKKIKKNPDKNTSKNRIRTADFKNMQKHKTSRDIAKLQKTQFSIP